MDNVHLPPEPPNASASADELAFLSIGEAADLVRTRRLSPVELTRAILERIDRLNSQLNAYITVTADWAMDLARQAEHEIGTGQYRGPLHGIPIGLKDLYETARVRTTAGSRVLGDYVPSAHAPVVARLLDAGAVIVGKQNLHEFAMGGTNINPFYGTAHTPWNLDHLAGGSSGGTGAAIAAGLCFGGLGSDTGGSIRIPASFCGICGLKPTYGRVSKRGAIPVSWSLDHVGPMARSAVDCAVLLNAIAGFDPDDVDSVDVPIDDYTADLGSDVAGLRVGVLANFLGDPLLDPEVRAGTEGAIEILAGAGARIDDVALGDLDELFQTMGTLATIEAAAYHGAWLESRARDYSPGLLDALREASEVKATWLSAAFRTRAASGRKADQLMRDHDVLVGPTTPQIAPTTDVPVSLLARFTAPFDVNGLPALSVPCGFTQAMLPIGLTIVGRRWGERTVLRVGAAYQRLTDWHRRRPAIE
jgi:aspartyl-tRNA(Asn)/glutamyl-tRNA(Gln) amidotransferase subunit A